MIFFSEQVLLRNFFYNIYIYIYICVCVCVSKWIGPQLNLNRVLFFFIYVCPTHVSDEVVLFERPMCLFWLECGDSFDIIGNTNNQKSTLVIIASQFPIFVTCIIDINLTLLPRDLHRLHPLQRDRKNISCIWHYISSDGEAWILNIWEWGTLSLSSYLCPFRFVHVRVPSMGEIDFFWTLFISNKNTWYYITVYISFFIKKYYLKL